MSRYFLFHDKGQLLRTMADVVGCFEWSMKKGGRGPDYIQERMGHTRRSFSHGITFNSNAKAVRLSLPAYSEILPQLWKLKKGCSTSDPRLKRQNVYKYWLVVEEIYVMRRRLMVSGAVIDISKTLDCWGRNCLCKVCLWSSPLG